MTATFTMEGMTAMHFASLITLSGIALSGVAIISFRTWADASRRLSISDRSLSSADHARPTQSKRPAPSTRKYLGNAQLILVISRPLPCSQRATVKFLTRLNLARSTASIPSGSRCKVDQGYAGSVGNIFSGLQAGSVDNFGEYRFASIES